MSEKFYIALNPDITLMSCKCRPGEWFIVLYKEIRDLQITRKLKCLKCGAIENVDTQARSAE